MALEWHGSLGHQPLYSLESTYDFWLPPKLELSLSICGGIGSRTPHEHRNPQMLKSLSKMAQNDAYSRFSASLDSQMQTKNSAGIIGGEESQISVDPRTSHSCCSRVKCTLTWRRTDVILIYYNLVFPLWKCFPPLDIKLFFQFTDEDHQNHIEHTLEGKKSNHRTWRQYPQNQAKKLHSISATNTQEPK